MTEVSERPATRRRENTRARLMLAAHEVFAEVGMDAASVEMICERAGFTRGAFYSNFESKNELFLALVTDMAEQKMDEVAGRVKSLPDDVGDDPAQLVRMLVGASFGASIDPDLMNEIRAQATRDPRMATAYLAWNAALRGRVEEIVGDVASARGIRLRLPLTEVAQLLLDVSDATCVDAALEGCTREEIGERLNARIALLMTALVETPGA